MSYLSQNTEWKFGESYKLFYFQVKGTPAPLFCVESSDHLQANTKHLFGNISPSGGNREGTRLAFMDFGK